MENEATVVEETTTTEEVATEEVKEVETPEVTEVKEEKEEFFIPPPKKQTAQERINAVIKKQRDAEREVERLKRLVDANQAVSQVSTRPQVENFVTQEAYEDALFAWRDTGKSSEMQAIQRQRDEADAIAKFRTKAEKVKEIYEDFDEVVNNPVFTDTMRDVLLRSDDGAMVSYFLGRPENYEAAEKIRSLPETQQVYELGKLEAKLILAQKQKKPTGAPSPISPVGASGGKVLDESNMSDQEWFELEKKREYEKIKKKYGG